VIAAIVAVRAPVARADAAAEALFREGRELIKAGDVAGACDRFQRSNAIEPKVGTLLNLGDCREQQGHIAEAWSAFSDAKSLATVQGDARADEAGRRAGVLEPKLAWLTIAVTADGRAPELAISRNGEPVATAVWDRAVPVDPGTHAIIAVAPGYKPWSQSITLAIGTRTSIDVPALAIDPDAPRPEIPEPAGPGIQPPLPWIGFGLAAGGTSDSDIVGGLRVVAGYPVPHGAARATLQALYTQWSDDADPYHDFKLYAVGLGFDYFVPWAKGLASAGGLGVGLDILDDNYANGLQVDRWFAFRVSPIVVRIASPKFELGIHLMYVLPAKVVVGVVGFDWFVK
jgi:hypothetical protein